MKTSKYARANPANAGFENKLQGHYRTSMDMRIKREVHEAMIGAARRAAPLEACGLCGGRDDSITEFYELTNADASGEHYSLIPAEQFAAVRDMRAKNIDMLAVWHSHPATPARMSQEDIRLAYSPDLAYLIVSLARHDSPDVRGFTVSDSTVSEIRLVLEEISGE